MIDPKELRIGNWIMDVEPYNDIFEITDIHINKAGNGWSFRPIPLTKEWMVKFGATDKWDYNRWEIAVDESHNIGHWLWEEMEKTELWCDDNSYTQYPPLRYVHQLQNLYFALTGKELEYSPLSPNN